MKNYSDIFLNSRKVKDSIILNIYQQFFFILSPEFHMYLQFLTSFDTVSSNLIYTSHLHWENSVFSNLKLLAVNLI